MNQKLQKKMNNSGKRECRICKKSEILIEHHIHGRDIPDYNNSWNLCYICSNCHTKVHHGLVIIEGWISTTDGLELIWHKQGEPSLTGNDAKPYVILQ